MSGRRSDEAAILAEKHGFKDTWSLTGGLKAWGGPIQPFMDNHSPWVHSIFDNDTETAQYIVTDLGNTIYFNMRSFFFSHTLFFSFLTQRQRKPILLTLYSIMTHSLPPYTH